MAEPGQGGAAGGTPEIRPPDIELARIPALGPPYDAGSAYSDGVDLAGASFWVKGLNPHALTPDGVDALTRWVTQVPPQERKAAMSRQQAENQARYRTAGNNASVEEAYKAGYQDRLLRIVEGRVEEMGRAMGPAADARSVGRAALHEDPKAVEAARLQREGLTAARNDAEQQRARQAQRGQDRGTGLDLSPGV